MSLLGEKIRHECARSFHVTSRPAGEVELLDDSVLIDWLIALKRERLWSSIRCASKSADCDKTANQAEPRIEPAFTEWEGKLTSTITEGLHTMGQAVH
ncbi:hypothetical protein AVEN_91335-1 [Araneus ventricosus]|uniref:Uncharacterized protein n=1 Tax=Araneus ventricosus TaxID=182803 RepID=A0A4Y2VWV0_ARAVE|nr:hypothetical protein AVEN_91335-1 [Araneus ventricosus]